MLTFLTWTFGQCAEPRLSWTLRRVGTRRGLPSEKLGSPSVEATWKWGGELVCPWREHWYSGRSPVAFHPFPDFHPNNTFYILDLYSSCLPFPFITSFRLVLVSIYLSVCSWHGALGFLSFSFLFPFFLSFVRHFSTQEKAGAAWKAVGSFSFTYFIPLMRLCFDACHAID